MGYNLAVLGCGTMGIAILSGTISSIAALSPNGYHPSTSNPSTGTSTPTSSFHLEAAQDALPSRFVATVGRDETVKKLKKVFKELGGMGEQVVIKAGDAGNVAACEEADVILICSKPHMVKGILGLPGMQEALDGKIVISICAGVTIAQLESWCPSNTTVIRAMPNTPSKIREGMTIITPPTPTLPLLRSILLGIFTSCGRVRFLDEKHFDACTALAGSGPAFVALVLEAMADGGVMMGLPRAEALELAAQTVQGTGRMVLSGQHPAQLKDSVTTPGGCTIAGLLTMEDGKVRSTIARAIQVAANHASGLGQDRK